MLLQGIHRLSTMYTSSDGRVVPCLGISLTCNPPSITKTWYSTSITTTTAIITTLCSHKDVQTLASCSFNKYGVIWIILCKQHQHTSKNDMHIQLSLCLHFYLFYLLLNSYNGKDAKQRVFLGRLLVALKRAGCVVYWLWKVSVLVQQMFKVMSFCLLHWPTASVFCDVLDHMSLMHCIKSLVSQSCVLYNVHTVLHQSPNSAVNWVSGSTGLCGGHKYAEIK